MRKAARRYPATAISNSFRALSFRLILFVCMGGPVVVPISWGKPAVNRQPSVSAMPLDEIISRIGSIQRRLDSLTAVRAALRQDSAGALSESSQQGSVLSKKQAETDDAIAKKKNLAAGIRMRYEKSQQDSAAIIARTKEQMDRVRKGIAQLDAAIVAASNDLSAFSGRREQPGAPANADDRAIAQLQAQGAQYDSLIRMRQSEMMSFSARRSKLRQDSLDIETRRINDRNRFRMQMYPLDSLAFLCDAAMRQVEQKLAGDQADKNRKIAQLKESYSLMSRQKKDYEERVGRANNDMASLGAERQRLAQSAGSAQQHYEQLRAPCDKALNDAMNEMQRCTRDKPLLLTLRKKLRIDSAISKTRDALDKAIQLSAENKKGGKKLVERRETELDSLLAEQDMIIRSTPGLRQREAQTRGITVSQKAMLTDSALAMIDKKTAVAAAQLDKARRELSAFDQKNPPVRNPAGQRIAQLDTMMALKKKEAIQMMDWSDSLNMALQETQNTINRFSLSTQTGSPEIDRLIKAKKDEKAALADKRAKIQRDSAQNDAAGLEALNRLKNDGAALAGQAARTQNEIDRTSAERDKTRQSLNTALDKNRQAKNAVLAEKKKTDSIVALKQQDITNLSVQSDKLRQDSISLVRQQEQQTKNLSPTLASQLSTLSDYTKEINALQAQSDSLKRLVTAGKDRTNDEARRISQQIAAAGKLIESAQADIATLNAQSKDAFARLESDKRFYDSLITIAERERAAMTSQRDKVRQDSIATENSISKFLQKIASALKEHDNTIAARQKEVADATAAYNRALDDSAKTAENIAGVQLPGGQSMKSIDSLMAVRSKEITDLQTRRDKSVLDSVKENEHLSVLLSAAHNEIVKRSIALDQRKNELSLSMAVKNEGTGMDPLQRSYKDALTAATTEIQTQNDVIKKKKSEMVRLRTVRDALSNATEGSGTDSRLDRDKLYYDSLLTIASQELAAIIARRDIARQDSASAENGLRQAAQQKTAPSPERDNTAAMQKEVADAIAAYNQARGDSARIAGAIPNTLQPYNQSIRTIDALISVRGKELADLQNQRESAGKDGLQQNKRNADILAAAHSEIVKRSITLEQKRNELALAQAAKSSAQDDNDPSMRNYKQALEAATLELSAENELIGKKKDEIMRLQNVRDAINARIKLRDKPLAALSIETRPSAMSPRDSAQKRSEDIYVLVGENRIDDAAALFSQMQPFLKANLDQETFQALRMTITEMGGTVK